MAATIEYYMWTATIDGYEWTSNRESLAGWLNAQLDSNGPSGADPNPDYNEALRAAELLGEGAEVVRFDESDYVKDRVY